MPSTVDRPAMGDPIAFHRGCLEPESPDTDAWGMASTTTVVLGCSELRGCDSRHTLSPGEKSVCQRTLSATTGTTLGTVRFPG
jgi:hypothetical protein